MSEFCKDHGNLMELYGRIAASSAEHASQLKKLFEKLDDMKTCIDQNEVRADIRDKKLDEINHKIENGLRSAVEETKRRIELLTVCLERRKQLREESQKKGFHAWIKRGLDGFKEKSAYIIVTAAIVGGTWFIIWLATRIKVFHEGPMWILKLFGVG